MVSFLWLKDRRTSIHKKELSANKPISNGRRSPDFENQWSDTPKDFYEWCFNYDDLKHITKGKI
jgi:hypothetical protein